MVTIPSACKSAIQVRHACYLRASTTRASEEELLSTSIYATKPGLISHAKCNADINRRVPLPTLAVEAVSQWLSVRPATELEHVFLSKPGKPLDERSIRYLVKYYMRKAGIKKQASAHTLRHTFGAFKSAKTVDFKTLQYWMGHKSPETALHYLHLVKKRAPELMEPYETAVSFYQPTPGVTENNA